MLLLLLLIDIVAVFFHAMNVEVPVVDDVVADDNVSVDVSAVVLVKSIQPVYGFYFQLY